jgi:phosphomannomutase
MEPILSVKFGTSGLRGLSVDLVGRTTALYVSAFAQYLLKSGRALQGDNVYVGMDFRDSSPAISAMAMQALKAAGLNPLHIGTLPTPALAAFAMDKNSASLMVTGSHIPADRNGIKFYRPDGEIDKADENEIVAWASKLDTNFMYENVSVSAPATLQEIVSRDFLARNKLVLGHGTLAGLRVGVYQHSTVARDMLVEILEYFGAKVTPLGRSESFIPVDTEAVSETTLQHLKTWAATKNFDAFVSADGDGDRPLVADENGKPVRGDIVGLLTAEFLQAKIIVTPVSSNSSIEKEAKAQVIRTRIGSPYVIAGMNLPGATEVMGFEANGGVLTASDFAVAGGILKALPTRDCFLPILAMLNFCKLAGQPLSKSLAARKFSAADGDRLENFSTEKSAALMQHLQASAENRADFLRDIGTVASTSSIDGLRVTLQNGSIIHYRPSGNAPELRCYTEAATEADARALLQRGLNAALAFQPIAKPQSN